MSYEATICVVGIDPGLIRPAMACVNGQGICRWIETLDGDLLKAKPRWERASVVASWAYGVLLSRPHHGEMLRIFIEDAAYNRQFQSEALASCRQALYERLKRLSEAPPEPVGVQEAKKALGGHGHAHKEALVRMASRLYEPFDTIFRTKSEQEAAADALAVALAGLGRLKKDSIGVGVLG